MSAAAGVRPLPYTARPHTRRQMISCVQRMEQSRRRQPRAASPSPVSDGGRGPGVRLRPSRPPRFPPSADRPALGADLAQRRPDPALARRGVGADSGTEEQGSTGPCSGTAGAATEAERGRHVAAQRALSRVASLRGSFTARPRIAYLLFVRGILDLVLDCRMPEITLYLRNAGPPAG